MLINCIAVGIGGFLGAVLRYLIGLIPLKTTNGIPFNFPLWTLIINVIGAFAIGLIAALAVKNGNLDERWVLSLKVGLCGGFTTFSSFSLESVNLFQSGRTMLGVLYISLSVVLCIVAVISAQMIVSK